jgi:hypothetical protein
MLMFDIRGGNSTGAALDRLASGQGTSRGRMATGLLAEAEKVALLVTSDAVEAKAAASTLASFVRKPKRLALVVAAKDMIPLSKLKTVFSAIGFGYGSYALPLLANSVHITTATDP